MNYRIEKRVIDGQEVEVKVYPPFRRQGPRQYMRVKDNGAYRQGALHAAKESGKKLEVRHGRV